MKRYLLYLSLLLSLILSNSNAFAQPNIEVRVRMQQGLFTKNDGTCSSCGGTSAINATVNLKFNFGSLSSAVSVGGITGCNTYQGSTSGYTYQTSSYSNTATIVLSATDARANGSAPSGSINCALSAVNEGNATANTITFTPVSQAVAVESAAAESRRAGSGTTTAGARWTWEWRYATVGTGGTISTATTSYCNSAAGVLLSGDNVGATYRDVLYQWQQSSDNVNFTDISGATGQTYTIPSIGATTYYRRKTRYRNSFSGTPTYLEANSNTITITIQNPPTATGFNPTGGTFCAGQPMAISLTGFNPGSSTPTISWYTDPDYTQLVQSGFSTTLSITAPTGVPSMRYYPLATQPASCGGSGTTMGLVPSSVLANFVNSSKAPDSIEASATTICNGSSILLTMRGAVLGTNARYEWSTSPSFATIDHFSATDSTWTVSPIANVTYYARVGNTASPCAASTASVSKDITVNQPSVAPDSIAATQDFYCQDDPTQVTLQQMGGVLGTDAYWEWYDDAGLTNVIGTGNSIPVAPSATTTYYVRAVNTASPCTATTSAVSKEIQFKTRSFEPDSIGASVPGLCKGSDVTLTVYGGSLGEGAQWVWYAGACGTTPIDTGVSITVAPEFDTDYFVRAEGECNNTDCVTKFIRVFQPSVDPTGIAIPAAVCFDAGGFGTATVQGGTAGTGLQWYWYPNDSFDPLERLASGPSFVFDVYDYRENSGNTELYVRAENTGDFGPIPSPCVENTNYATVDISSIAIEVTPTDLYYLNIDETLFCDTATANIEVEGDLLDGLGNPSSAQYFLFTTDPGVSFTPALDSNITGLFTVNTNTTTTYYVAIGNTCGYGPASSTTVTVNYSSVAPTQLIASVDSICNGDATNVTITADGSLGTDAIYEWSTDGFATVDDGLGNANIIVVSPTVTTTYSARINNTATPCVDVSGTVVSALVTVIDPSVAPTELTLSADSICNGDATNVTISADGTLGTDAEYEWSTDGFATVDGGLGNTNTIVVSPTATTTYSARIVGTAAACSDVSATVASATLYVTEPSVAPTGLTVSVDSICNGDATNVTISADGTLGTDAEYEWSTDGFATVDGGLGNTNTIVVSPTATTTYSARIVGPAPCSDVSGTVVSALVTVIDPSVAPTELTLSADSICNGDATNVTISADGTLGTDAEYEWSTDGFATVDGGLGNTNTIVVSPTATTTYSARIVGTAAACSDVSATIVSGTVYVLTPSAAPASVTVSNPDPCYGETIILTQVGGSLGDDSQFEWATDAAFTNVIATTLEDTIHVVITEPTTYYVRVLSGDAVCGNSNTYASADVDWVQAVEITDAPLAPSSVVASVCEINDNNWHYFIDENGNTLAAINSNGQNLGTVEWEAVVGDNGPYTNPNNQVCVSQQEYYVGRYFRLQTQNQPASPVSIRLFITPAEYAAHKVISDAQDAQYKNCWGSTNTAADLQVSAFFTVDGGNPGEAMTSDQISFTSNGGPNNSHQYQFDMNPVDLGGRIGGRFDNTGTTFYIHNSGGRSSILPVELTSFTATYTDNAVLLNWTTASELNNDRFEVLRSTDAVNFTKIGTVAGNGTTSTPHAYSLVDTDVAAGTYYYQLRQVDFDGTADLSKIVSVVVPGAEKFAVGNFYPNPTSRATTINVTMTENADVVFTLYSIDGKRAISKVYNLAKGDNRIDIDVAGVAAGSYIGIFQTKGEVINRKLIVQE